MTYGPVDFVALEFKGNQFKGEILPEIMDLVNKDIVRVIDMIVVKKDAKGKVTHREMQEHNKKVLAVFDPLKAEINGMIQVEDIEMIGEKLEPNSTAAVMHVRIPHQVVAETMEKIASDEARLAAGRTPDAAL